MRLFFFLINPVGAINNILFYSKKNRSFTEKIVFTRDFWSDFQIESVDNKIKAPSIVLFFI